MKSLKPGTIFTKRIAGWQIVADSLAWDSNYKSIHVDDDHKVVVLYTHSPGWVVVLIGDEIGILSENLLKSDRFIEYLV